jgi:competence protein ComEC
VLVNFSKPGRNYFWQIILLSILIQIATIPFLMHHFRNLSLLGFVANVLAIPLVSFLIMPLGFLALFLMPIDPLIPLVKPALLLMNPGIIGLEKIANFVSGISYSHFTSPWLPSSGLALAIFGLLLICLTKTRLSFVGIAIFLAAFLTIFSVKKPDIIFERDQKFFAVYSENGLEFSKNLRPSKQRNSWMRQFDENELKTLPCKKNRCEIEVKNKKILVLLQRNKISEICASNFDVIANLTKKYQLPACVGEDKIKIDNKDFYSSGTQFLFLKNKKLSPQKIYHGSKKKTDNKGDFGDDAEEIDGDF